MTGPGSVEALAAAGVRQEGIPYRVVWDPFGVEYLILIALRDNRPEFKKKITIFQDDVREIDGIEDIRVAMDAQLVGLVSNILSTPKIRSLALAAQGDLFRENGSYDYLDRLWPDEAIKNGLISLTNSRNEQQSRINARLHPDGSDAHKKAVENIKTFGEEAKRYAQGAVVINDVTFKQLVDGCVAEALGQVNQ